MQMRRESEMKALKEIFEEYNTTKDSGLDATELKEAMEKAGIDSSQRDIHRIITIADTDDDGKIDFEELCSYLSHEREQEQDEGYKSPFSVHLDARLFDMEETSAYHNFSEELESKIRVIFNNNKGDNGLLTYIQFSTALNQAGNFSGLDVAKLYNKGDEDRNYHIDFIEFIKALWDNREQLTINVWKSQKDTNDIVEHKSPVRTCFVDERALDSLIKLQSNKAVEVAKESQVNDERENTQDDEKVEVTIADSFAVANSLTGLSPKSKQHVLSTSLKLLDELEELKISNEEQLEFFTRLLALRKTRTNEFVNLCNATI